MKIYTANDGRTFEHEFEMKFHDESLRREAEVETWLGKIVPKSNIGWVILDSCVLWLKR